MPRRGTGSIGKEFVATQRALRALEQSLARLAGRLREIGQERTAAPSRKPGRKLKLSPARLRALRLHGRYLGYLRQLKPRAKAQVRALRARKGVRVAIARARQIGAKHASRRGNRGS